MADVANDADIGQEVHLDRDLALARAFFAAPALDVEAEAADLVSAQLRFLRRGKKRADLVHHPRVGRRIAARSASDRGLIQIDHFI